MEQSHSKLGAKRKWTANASAVSTVVPPCRDRALWRITTTKTVEGLPDQPKYGGKHNYVYCENLIKKLAADYLRLMKENEDIQDSGRTKKEAFDTKVKGWQQILEELLAHGKEKKENGNAKGQ